MSSTQPRSASKAPQGCSIECRLLIVDLSHAAIQLGRSLFPLFALALDLPENFFDEKVGIHDTLFGIGLTRAVLSLSIQTTKPAAILRLLHYPPQAPTKCDVVGEPIGIGAHTE